MRGCSHVNSSGVSTSRKPQGSAAVTARPLWWRCCLRVRAHAELFVFVGTLAPAGNVSQVCCHPGFVTCDSESALTYFQWLPPSDKCAQRIGSAGRRKPIAGPAFGSDFI